MMYEGAIEILLIRILSGEEYTAARSDANAENARVAKADGPFSPMEIHEIKPVQFGGDPVSHSNKTLIFNQKHWVVSKWWAQLARDLGGK
jgi:filamentous hemagglutinin